MDRITSIDDCVRRDLLAWVAYPFGKACFPRPQYRVDGKRLVPIDPSVFPDIGSLAGLIMGGEDATSVKERFGELVVMRINTSSDLENPAYPDPNPNRYGARLDPYRSVDESDLSFTALKTHPLSKQILQVVKVDKFPDFGAGVANEFEIRATKGLYTELILLAKQEAQGLRLAGPFANKTVVNDTATLAGSPDFDYRGYLFPTSLSDEVKSVLNKDDVVAAVFVEGDVVSNLISSGRYEAKYDLLPKRKLVEVVQRSLSLSGETKDLSKNKMRKLKNEILLISEQADEFVLDSARRERILDLMSDVEYFGSLPEDLQDAVFERMPNEKLAELILSDQNFPRFKAQLLDMPELKTEVAEERRRLTASLDDLKDDCDRADKELVEKRGRLDELNKSLEERVRLAEKAKSDELERLEAECAGKRVELGELDAEMAALRAEKEEAKSSIDSLVALLDNKAELASEVMKSALVQKVASVAATAPSREAGAPVTAAPVLIISDDGGDLVGRLFDTVCEKSGRAYTHNQLVNFYTCLSQGYITTFAGMPGTGKTSLCRLLAKGLGIEGVEAGRFVEVGVERGWTSCRDYIGYYNPLTRVEEKTNPEVFSLLERMALEDGADPTTVAPGIILLDEANLSPIEHYWAPFLKACDSFREKPATLPIGGDRLLVAPSNVRFLATVNYDHTTEELSPRFLDRSWVIMLSPDGVATDDHPEPSSVSETPAVSYDCLMRVFGQRVCNMNQSMEAVYADVLQACVANGRPVSPRSQHMMRGFISAAVELMDTSSVDTRYDPIDFAIAQKILPTITGPMEVLGDLVEALSRACAPLKTSSRLIENIKRTGENSGYYQFFA